MLHQIKMPSSDQATVEVTIVSWRVKQGDRVKAGQILLEFEGDKSIHELESPHNGTVREILASEGQTVSAGSTIAIVGDSKEKIPADWLTVDQGEHDNTIADGLIALSSFRRQINRKVVKSKQHIPHYYIGTMIDMTNASAYRKKLIRQKKKVSLNALFVNAIVKGLKIEPSINMKLVQDCYVPGKSIDIGMAIETPKGVVIGVVEDVGTCELVELSNRINDVITAVQANRIGDVKTSGACMTISNLGMYRSDVFIPIIHPGEAAIIGIGSLAERPMVVKGEVVARKTMPITLCADHRIVDGAVAGRFLEAFADYLEALQ